MGETTQEVGKSSILSAEERRSIVSKLCECISSRVSEDYSLAGNPEDIHSIY